MRLKEVMRAGFLKHEINIFYDKLSEETRDRIELKMFKKYNIPIGRDIYNNLFDNMPIRLDLFLEIVLEEMDGMFHLETTTDGYTVIHFQREIS